MLCRGRTHSHFKHNTPLSGTSTPLSNELCAAALTREEVQLADALLGRVAKLAAAASDKGVRLMIDAEHTYFQPVREDALRHPVHPPPAIMCQAHCCFNLSYWSIQVDCVDSHLLNACPELSSTHT